MINKRPRYRSDCKDGPRPCKVIECRYHIATDYGRHRGGIRHVDLTELKETCVLDVADQGPTTLEETGEILGITRERIRQIEFTALRKARLISSARR